MYPFKHIPIGTEEIRLVELIPGSAKPADQIECRIFHTDLKHTPEYAALSYTWGDPSVTIPILVNGYEYCVTQNLALALLQYRQTGKHRLWIDAICINQKDGEEHSRQIQLMRFIYENARLVVIWLGPSFDDSDEALEAMVIITNNVQKRKVVLGSVLAVVNSISYSDLFGAGDSQVHPQALISITRLFDRDWWFRTWILQEATASTSVLLTCGKMAILWDAVYTTCLLVGLFSLRPGMEAFRNLGIGGPSMVQNFKARRGMVGDQKLLTLLEDNRRSESSDPRDKVYAMLSFATDVEDTQLRPDYSKSVCEVYIDVVIWSVQTYGHLDFLGYCTPFEPSHGLPSWVPDWSDRSQQRAFAKGLTDMRGNIAGDAYSASGPPPALPDRSHVILPVSDGKVMLKGFRLDTIQCCFSVCTDFQDTSVEKSWLPTNAQEIYPFTGETIYQAYLRTIVADIYHDYSRPTHRGCSMVWPEDREHTGDWKEMREKAKVEQDYLATLKKATIQRRFIVTKGTLMGLAPFHAQEGDLICILQHGKVLYVLRPRGEYFRFIGECYIHGMMDGEAISVFRTGERDKRDDIERQFQTFIIN